MADRNARNKPQPEESFPHRLFRAFSFALIELLIASDVLNTIQGRN